jgi:cobalt/nickel transport system permease protein
MGAGHLVPLSVPGPSPVHAAAPHVKVVATLLFVVAIVATPRQAVGAFGVHAVLLATVAVLARVPARALLPRLVIEVPFLAFALLLPFVARGERTELLGLVSVSVDGSWAAWNILAKGLLGLTASLLLVATTPADDLLRGLERLGVPTVVTAIAGSMLRYLGVIDGQMRRMQVARISRGHDPRWIWQARAVASTVGALFVRTFERGERVHLAMVSRGYTGSMPAVRPLPPATAAGWAVALAVPAAAALTAAAAAGWMP